MRATVSWQLEIEIHRQIQSISSQSKLNAVKSSVDDTGNTTSEGTTSCSS